MLFGFSLARLMLVWMVGLVSVAPWLDSYVETATASVDACEERPVFGTELRCVAVLTALGYHESRYDPAAVGKAGEVGVWQIAPSWNPPADVAGQAKLAVRLLDESERRCHDRPLDERAGWYASGGAVCGRPETSRIRMRLAAALLR